ncbi:NAD(P)H-dependent oxidoreductase [Comamonas sp. Tr-654]|uniref:NAD(P)H-dependent oxidoreductase n=1 Tax=Comamonas sp. Tr-654 TaxID=2608341 RepID=UPI0014219215|nr:NAD(P)H-dependent oxidoreductase [Comamonas sp. Tr-654]NIF85896.1 NAD(P)H-dependent oxidoreductase [Comamonas sp. Tr-654]
MSRRILIILGQPSSQSLCSHLAHTYADAARQSGAEVRLLSLGEMYFDPVLRHGYAHVQPLEPDLRDAQVDIAWAQHLVWVYPIWWGGLPALLKGFLDRIFLPGFAFKYRANSVLWDRLLTGRTAELLVTMDSPPWYYRWVQRQPGHRQMKQAILEFSGIRPVRVHSFGPVVNSSDAVRAGWIRRACRLGARAGA